jgi:membrane-bound metal-dependent hydrolase YbcI (DUF457 family)
MAGFKTHIGTSTVLGVGYGVTGYLCGAPLPTCMLAGGLCSVSGMLPDIDSGSGVPLRESMAFAAAVVPMLMIDRFQHMGMSHESIALAGMLIYLGIRFGAAEIIRRYTVHRGMWHSLPAAATVGLLAFLICSCDEMNLRLFKAGAVVLGFMSHLVLDEIWSVEFRGGAIRLKKSFGTALKLWSKSRWANVSTYAKLAALLAWAYCDPMLMEHFGFHEHEVPQTAQKRLGELMEQGEKLLR